MQPTTSQCVHILLFPPGTVVLMVADAPFFFKALICSNKRLISCCFLATVSTDIARLAANIRAGLHLQPFAWPLLRYYPNILPASPAFDLRAEDPPPSFYGLVSVVARWVSQVTLQIEQNLQFVSSTSWAASALRFATYVVQKIVFHSD